jgi:2-alkyl-3-oxoalkanoate reductase
MNSYTKENVIMEQSKIELFVLGATGYIGKEVVKEAISRGCRVKALARSPEKAADLQALGALIIPGDASNPSDWIKEAAGSDVLIDLVQPELPKRIGLKQITQVSDSRQAITRRLLAALFTIAENQRPLLLSVSGLDDLTPDAAGRVHDDSPLNMQFPGFAHIGIPVRKLIEESRVASAFAYLGLVYGPGKAFANTIFPQLAAGRFRMAGSGENRVPLVHVEDAARALVQIATLGREAISGHSFVIADGHQASMKEFLTSAAQYLGAPPPSGTPLWLARIFAGSILCDALARDIIADPASLAGTGFKFRYPSYREGLPPTLKRLGYETGPKRAASSILDSRSLFWTVMILALGSIFAVNFLHFPLSVPWMRDMAGGAPILDTRLGYSVGAVYQFFDTLGEPGRAAYLKMLWTIDLILPILFGFFLSLTIRKGIFRRLSWAPFLASAVDYAENTAITVLLLRYPLQDPGMVHLSSALTVTKFVFYAIGLLLAIGGLVGRSRKERTHP